MDNNKEELEVQKNIEVMENEDKKGMDGEKNLTEGDEKVTESKKKKKKKKKGKATEDDKEGAEGDQLVAEGQQNVDEGGKNVAEGSKNVEEGDGDDEKADSSKKKKKKAKKKEKANEEEKPDPKKKTNPKFLARIKADLAKAEEERKKEEEKDREFEELLKKKEEERKLEAERREKKKQKEKERKQRLKEEGKLLTAKEKHDRRRAQELLEARGLDLDAHEDQEKKKKPRYEKLKKRHPQQQPEEATSTKEGVETAVEEVKDDTPKESWEDQGESSEAEDWEDLADDVEKEEAEAEEQKKMKESAVTDDMDDEDEDDDEEDEDEEEEEEDESEESEDADPMEVAKERIRVRHEKFEAARSEDILRAAVVCVLGHVDTGKTKILDKLRHTNVQDGEAGGITQQIGATNVPAENILEATKMCKAFQEMQLRLPGLLIIDTPGHESFSNLRSRGSSLCDLAILVVDVMHGLEPQTKESIRLLRDRGTPFVVALNKIDRLYQWKTNPHGDVQETMKMQLKATYNEFTDHLNQIITEFAIQEINVKLFYENPDPDEYISMVPTSAHTGDGMGNLLAYLCEFCQKYLAKRLSFTDELQASVMEVKEIHGLGTTIDVILVNGHLHVGETIILAGQEGPIVTPIRDLLLTQPMRELRVKNSYVHCKQLQGAQGVKIIAKDLEKALAGLPLHAASHDDEMNYYKEEVKRGLSHVLQSIKVSPTGVYVQASTLGSLEALLCFLKSKDIPYFAINIGPVHKRDVNNASVMVEKDNKWAVILAFDVKVEREAQELADNLGVRIFTADIIYHLHDMLINYIDTINKADREKYRDQAVFPVKLRILPQFIFNKRAPIVCGVVVEAGLLREGTPICVPSKENLEIGKVFSIESNNKQVREAKKGMEVCVRIDPTGDAKMIGRHFNETDMLVSKISRDSIDIVKKYFRDDLSKEDWKVMVELKKLLEIL